MASVDEAIDFLERHDSLSLGEVLPPPVDNDSQILPVDWPSLLPGSRDDSPPAYDWFAPFRLDDEFNRELEESSRREPITDKRELQAAGEKTRWDYCAWYQPIHFHGFDWGIFIREDCVRSLAVSIARFFNEAWLPGTASRLVAAATVTYYLHELFHHRVESFGFRLHVVTGHSCYLPYERMVYRPEIQRGMNRPGFHGDPVC